MQTAPHNHAKCTADLLARAEKTCASQGARLTDQRREVLSCVAQSHAAVGAYDVIERMAAHGPRPAPITVYRALDFLLSHNLVHKIESRNAFVACGCAHENASPALLICETCGNVDELVEPLTNKDLQRAANERGFRVSRAMIELSGTCHQCANV
jgi:Fur family transcriptional regulator, zinc uptake regulator